MNIIESILGDDYKIFFDEYFGRRPFAKKSSASHLIQEFSWSDVQEILPRHSDSWLARKGHLKDSDDGRLSYSEFFRGFCSGYTLVIRKAQKNHVFMESLASEMNHFFNAQVDIQLYVTPGGATGFDWHFDEEDVFVFQTQGSKEFFLYENSDSSVSQQALPKSFRLSSYVRGPEIRCTLLPGDFLYIPARYWHKATSQYNSFHISAGVMKTKKRRSFFKTSQTKSNN